MQSACARAARSRAEADGAIQGRRRAGGEGRGEAAARHRQRLDAGRRLLPGVSRPGAAHAAPRLSRGRPDGSGPQDLLDARPAVQSQAEKALAQELDRLDKARKQKQDQRARRRRGRDGAAERRSDRDGRRPAGELRRLQSRAGRAALDRLAGQAGDLSRGGRERAVQRRVDRRGRAGRSEAGERQGVDAAEHFRGVLRPGAAGARARAVAESRDRAPRASTSACRK